VNNEKIIRLLNLGFLAISTFEMTNFLQILSRTVIEAQLRYLDCSANPRSFLFYRCSFGWFALRRFLTASDDGRAKRGFRVIELEGCNLPPHHS